METSARVIPRLHVLTTRMMEDGGMLIPTDPECSEGPRLSVSFATIVNNLLMYES